MEYANVIVDISHEKLDRVFQYRIPEHLKEHLMYYMTIIKIHKCHLKRLEPFLGALNH